MPVQHFLEVHDQQQRVKVAVLAYLKDINFPRIRFGGKYGAVLVVRKDSGADTTIASVLDCPLACRQPTFTMPDANLLQDPQRTDFLDAGRKVHILAFQVSRVARSIALFAQTYTIIY